ncbi:hypothetical protein J3U75_04680 [Snodgrassella sp. B3088]|nr:hypothetical protein [Snodgrassella sp. B3088]MCX8748681.1 hypothetical protein [Snodgrassella sp. B3088]
MFPVSLAAKAKSLGFTAQELKAMTVPTKDIYFVDVTNKKTGALIQGDHHGTKAGSYFHKELIKRLNRAKSKKQAMDIIEQTHKKHMRYKSGC